MSSIYKVVPQRNERHGYTRARLNISVGRDYHEGEKFAATVDWVARHFNRSAVNLCDTLQRHNLMAMGIDPTRAHAMAVAAGDAWIERNRAALGRLPDLTISRWDDWRSHPQWDAAMDRVRDLYITDAGFARAVDDSVSSFLQGKNTGAAMALHSRDYVLEEAAYALISSDADIADIYPGTFLPVFDYMRQRGWPAPASMTSITLKRRKRDAA